MKILLTGIILMALTGVPALAQQTKPGSDTGDTVPKNLDQTDKKFLKEAAIGNVAEVELGQMAQQKAQATQVKQFGQKMVQDHSTANDELKNIAQTQHVSLPTELDAKHKNAKQSLEKLSGSQFDKAYMTLMVQEHSTDVQKFQNEAKSAHDQTVKKFAESTTPILQQHLQEAKRIEGGIENGSVK